VYVRGILTGLSLEHRRKSENHLPLTLCSHFALSLVDTVESEEGTVDEKIAIVMVMVTLAFGVVSIMRMALEHMGRAKTLRVQSDLYNRLIDKFGTSNELLAYLQSEAGQQLFKTPATTSLGAYGRIMNAVQYGAIAVVVGAGILAIGSAFKGTEAADVTFVFGWLAITIGAALLVSSVLSFALSRKFGLINGESKQKQAGN
jgi:predicted outer membrane lipoprotein